MDSSVVKRLIDHVRNSAEKGVPDDRMIQDLLVLGLDWGTAKALVEKITSSLKKLPTLQLHLNNRTIGKSRYLLYDSYGRKDIPLEDVVIENVFTVIGTNPEGPWCVEFGSAHNGYLRSNVVTLIKNKQWSGVLIEADQERFSELQKLYKGLENVHLFCNCVSFNQKDGDHWESILDNKTPVLNNFDFLGIDLDGCDWYAWKSLLNIRPRVVCVKFNSTIQNDVLFVQVQNPKIRQGCSLLALIELGKTKGYELVATTVCNAFFVVKEEFSKFGIEDNSIDAIHKPACEGRIFHGYDGTIYTIGMPKLFWNEHEKHIAHDELQVLTEESRNNY